MDIEELKKNIVRIEKINKIVTAENEELKKINYGLREDYERILKYQKFFSIIDRFRNLIIVRALRKIKNLIRKGKNGRV